MNTIKTRAHSPSSWPAAAMIPFWPNLEAPMQHPMSASALAHMHPQQAAQVHRPLDMATVLDLLYG